MSDRFGLEGLVRAARLSGHCYPSDPTELRAWLDGFLAEPGPALHPDFRSLPGMALPHIDPRGGGSTYGHGYRAIQAADPADVYVLLGIGHAGLRYGLSLCPASFETPLGLARLDTELAEEVIARCGDWILADQQVQASEHSLELQTVFMTHVLKGPYTILPLLTAFGGPVPHPQLRQVLGILKGILEESGRRVRVIASVDFSHVGPLYGDPGSGSERMGEVREQDLRAIARLEAADAPGFWDQIEGAENPTRICGVSAMWSLLELVEPSRGRLLDYAETVMDRRDSRVTFASVAFG